MDSQLSLTSALVDEIENYKRKVLEKLLGESGRFVPVEEKKEYGTEKNLRTSPIQVTRTDAEVEEAELAWKQAVTKDDFSEIYGFPATEMGEILSVATPRVLAKQGEMETPPDSIDQLALVGTQPFIRGLQSRLSFLHYYLCQAEASLSWNAIRRLWAACVEFAISQRVSQRF